MGRDTGRYAGSDAGRFARWLLAWLTLYWGCRYPLEVYCGYLGYWYLWLVKRRLRLAEDCRSSSVEKPITCSFKADVLWLNEARTFFSLGVIPKAKTTRPSTVSSSKTTFIFCGTCNARNIRHKRSVDCSLIILHVYCHALPNST